MKIKDLVPLRSSRREELTRFGEMDPFKMMREDMSRMFGDFMSLEKFPSLFETPMRGMVSPRIDVSETEKEVLITAELPGMEEKEVELLLTPETLTIKGEKKMESEEKERDYYRSERSYGSFCRTIGLPSGIDKDKTTATFKKGVLKVTLPKTVQAQKEVKKLEIKKEGS
ncbi:MAG: Hsp20/alpha crystallin family protein [Nitrospinae bacterium]|nr:Hsp20/alpha crystallin family protein [Nitrospinota bacterium]